MCRAPTSLQCITAVLWVKGNWNIILRHKDVFPSFKVSCLHHKSIKETAAGQTEPWICILTTEDELGDKGRNCQSCTSSTLWCGALFEEQCKPLGRGKSSFPENDVSSQVMLLKNDLIPTIHPFTNRQNKLNDIRHWVKSRWEWG